VLRDPHAGDSHLALQTLRLQKKSRFELIRSGIKVFESQIDAAQQNPRIRRLFRVQLQASLKRGLGLIGMPSGCMRERLR
jgi:hypothetical protein